MLTKSYVSSIVIVGAAALVLAVLIMQASTPAGIGPAGVTGWFLLVLIGLCALCAAAAYGAALKLQPKLAGRRRIIDSARRGLLAGGALTIVLGLNSLQQLNLRDVLLLVALGTLVEFYTVARS